MDKADKQDKRERSRDKEKAVAAAQDDEARKREERRKKFGITDGNLTSNPCHFILLFSSAEEESKNDSRKNRFRSDDSK